MEIIPIPQSVRHNDELMRSLLRARFTEVGLVGVDQSHNIEAVVMSLAMHFEHGARIVISQRAGARLDDVQHIDHVMMDGKEIGISKEELKKAHDEAGGTFRHFDVKVFPT